MGERKKSGILVDGIRKCIKVGLTVAFNRDIADLIALFCDFFERLQGGLMLGPCRDDLLPCSRIQVHIAEDRRIHGFGTAGSEIEFLLFTRKEFTDLIKTLV